ncbi:T9SS type A sorting domain-containing protein [Crocinitomix algicola]|uniref:T9SS type A sorting domain-containing protein n=1 Tax=Crocinitomix algicola TaxID=1740263 RepID=UPI00082F6F51|nr:T9SS type A sorting domain-containing protein [Crocinitomix algicola]
MRKKRFYLLTTGLLFSAGSLMAQDAFSASGKNVESVSGSFSYTIGQCAYSYFSGDNGNSSEGVQQAYIISDLAITPSKIAKLEVYPNPAVKNVVLKIGDTDLTGLSYQITTLSGQILVEQEIQNSTTELNFVEFPPAPYFINILNQKQIIESIKILKN